jgi:protein O-mannosyl-transferase
MKKQVLQSRSKKATVSNSYLDRIAWIGILVVGVLIFYKPVGKYEMINWDEKKYLQETPFIKKINAENVKKMFTEKVLASYNPLVLLSFSIDYSIAKTDWGWYHNVNVFFHLMNALLLFACLKKLKLKTEQAGFISAFFAFHPMAVEAVAWIAGRKDMLYAFFYLAAVFSYLHFKDNGKKTYLVISVLLGLLSCLSKVQAITLPAALILADYLRVGKFRKRDLVNKIPFLILSLVFGLINISGTTLVADKYSVPPTFVDKFMYSVMAFGLYVEKLIFPHHLAVIHGFPVHYSNEYWLVFFLGICIFFMMTFFLIKYFKKAPWMTAGIIYFIALIFPVLHLVGYNSALIYERFTYLAGVGLFVAVVRLDELVPKWNSVRMKILLPALAIMVVITIQRIPVWKNAVTLWTDAIEKNPLSEQAYNNRGQFYDSKGESALALADFNSAITIAPQKPQAWNNRCVYYFRKQDWKKALEANDKVLEIDSSSVDGLSNRAGIYLNQQIFDSAIFYYQKLVRVSPYYSSGYYNQGLIYFKQQNYISAAEQFEKAVHSSPDYTSAIKHLAITYARMEKVDSARIYSSMAEKINPNSAAFREVSMELITMGNERYLKGDTVKALEYYLAATQVDPYNAEAYYDAGGVYLMLKDLQKARHCWKQTLRINPEHSEATQWLQRTGGN